MLEAMLWRAEISFSTHNRRYRIDIYRVCSGLYKWRFTSKIVLTLPLACGSSPWRASRSHEQSYLTEGQDLPSFRRIFYIYPQIIYYDHLNYANLHNFGWIFNQDMPLNLFLQKRIKAYYNVGAWGREDPSPLGDGMNRAPLLCRKLLIQSTA